MAEWQAKRDELGSASYWDRRAARHDLGAVMWPNLAFSDAVDRRQKQAILAMLPTLAGKTILDVGCGTGRLSFFLADHGADVTGTDFSDRMIARANDALQDRQRPGIRFRQASLRDLPTLGDRFDCVLSICCLSLSGATREVFQQDIETVCSLVKEGGYILLMEPIHRWWPLRRVCPFPVPDWLAEFGRHWCIVRRRDRGVFVPFKFVCGLLPVPAGLTRLLFELGEQVLRLPLAGPLMSDYKILLFQKSGPAAS